MSLRVSRAGYPLRPHTRSGGAPHYAPSLRSVAGLLGRSLDAAYEDTPPSFPTRFVTAPRLAGVYTAADVEAILAPRPPWTNCSRACARGAPRRRSAGRESSLWRIVIHCTRCDQGLGPFPSARLGRACSYRSVRGGEGVLGGAPAERAHRLGATARPNGGRSRTLPRRGHLHRPLAKMQLEALRSSRALGENHKTEGPYARVDNSLDTGCTFFDSRSSLPMVLID